MAMTFHISNGITETQVYPANREFVFVETKEDKQVWVRRRLDTELIFLGADFAYLLSQFAPTNCTSLVFIVKLSGTEKWRGKINLKKAKWDESRCTVRVKPDVIDQQSKILDIWERKENFLGFGTPITARPFIGQVICEERTDYPGANPPDWPLSSPPVAVGGLPALSPSEGWTVTRNEVNGVTQVQTTPIALYEAQLNITTRYCREFVAGVTPPPGSGWITVSGGFARTVVTILDNNKSDFDPSDNTLLQYYNVVGYDTETGNQSEIDNGRLLFDVVAGFISGLGLTIVSDFFQINPDATAPSNVAYTAANANLSYLSIFQKSDVKRGDAFQNATRGETSLKEILEMLREVFQVYWRVQGSTLRIEHVSYFSLSNSHDFATDSPSYVKKLNQYEFEVDKLPRLETFTWPDQTQIRDFAGVPIEYAGGCVDETLAPENHSAGPFYTDIQTAQRQPGLVEDAGFILANLALFNGDYYFVQETGVLSLVRYVNGHLAWANLHDKYWRHDRLFASGKLNGVTVTFLSSEAGKKQQEVAAPVKPLDYFDEQPGNKIRTEIGWGSPSSARYNTRQCILAAELLH
jgi:hypothetical protein